MLLSCVFLLLFLGSPFFSLANSNGNATLRVVDETTGEVHLPSEKFLLVTQLSLSTAELPSFSSSSDFLAAVSSRVFLKDYSNDANKLHSFVTFSTGNGEVRKSSLGVLRQFHWQLQLPLIFREVSNVLRTTFLESFRDAATYLHDGLEQLIYVSPSSVILTSDLLDNVYDRDMDNDVVYCNALPYSMALVLELFPYSIHALGLRPETIKSLEGNEVVCGVDVFVVSTHLLPRITKRIDDIMSHALLYEGYPSFRYREEVRDYFMSVVFFNLALFEEGVSMIELAILNDVHSKQSSLPSGVLIFPPPLASPAFKEYEIYINSDLVDAEEGSQVGLTFISPTGFTKDCETTLHGLGNIDTLRARWKDHLNDNTFCLLAGRLSRAVWRQTYFEFNSVEALTRAQNGQDGFSLLLSASCEDSLSDPSLQSRLNYVSVINSLQCIEHEPYYSNISKHIPRILPSFLRLNGCLDSSGSFHISFRERSTSVVKPVTCAEQNPDFFNEGSSPLTQLYAALESSAAVDLPCVLIISPALIGQEQEQFQQMVMNLGLLESSHRDASVAIGPHCSSSGLSSLSRLAEPELDRVIQKVIKASESFDPSEIQKMSSPKPHHLFPEGGVGINLLRDPNRFMTSISNCLPRDVFALLYGRLQYRGFVALGANSHFIPFDGTSGRSVVEKIILEYLAPLVVGSQEEARELGFVGAEWWIQSRKTVSPKEYHYDSAITWCRENGWGEQDLGNCPFYPQIGSIFYMTASGGPTVVFDEHIFEENNVPPIPEAVAIAFPQENRMGLFKGNRYHGVLHDPRHDDSGDPQSSKRLTLLINYWRKRDVGENFTHIMPQEASFLQRYEEMKGQVDSFAPPSEDSTSDTNSIRFQGGPSVQDFDTLPISTDIMEFLPHFKNQSLAPELFEAMQTMQRQKGGVSDFYSQAPVAVLSFPKNSTYSNYCRELIRKENISVARFTSFGFDEATGKPQIVTSGSIDGMKTWRRQWPHLPEDHEQEIRDMFSDINKK